MKSLVRDYIKVIMYTIISILFAMSTYIIIINIHHYNSLSGSINVSDLDSNYNSYKNNINSIEDILEKYSDKSNKTYLSFSKTINNMKKGGVFRLVPKTELSYKDLYELNDYFIEELINNSWVHILKDLEISNKYQNTIDLLISNSKYINSVFNGNSLVLYDSNLDNKISDNYHFILNNYLMYSNVILDMCSELGGLNGQVN